MRPSSLLCGLLEKSRKSCFSSRGKKLIGSRKVCCVGGFCVRFLLLLLLSLTRINFTAAALNQAWSALRETRDPSGWILGRWDGEGREKERNRSTRTPLSALRVSEWGSAAAGSVSQHRTCSAGMQLAVYRANRDRRSHTHTLSWTHRPLLSAAQQAWVIIVIIFFIFIIKATAADRLKEVAL